MAGTIQSLEKAINILYLFSHKKHTWGITEIAKALNMQKSTVFRLVDTMVKNGIMRKTNDNQRYRLGLKLFELGGVVFSEFHLKDIANKYIHDLSEKCGETVHMGILNETSILSIESSDTRNSLRPAILIGKTSPLHCTGIGKALFAFLDKTEQNELLNKITLDKYTNNTITKFELFVIELENIRERGYAVDDMEHEFGVRCIAAPIFDHTNKVIASLSISGPSVRVTPEKDEYLASQLIDICKTISTELGFMEGKY